MRSLRVPETNDYGLVLPPQADDEAIIEYLKPANIHSLGVNRHHLYWPRGYYLRTSELAFRFREHRFNSVWMTIGSHHQYHELFDAVPVPPDDVMQAFLDEAAILDELGVCMHAVQMMDKGIYEGRVRKIDKVQQHRRERLATIEAVFDLEDEFRVIPVEFAQAMLHGAEVFLDRAA